MRDTNTASVDITVTNWNSGEPSGDGECFDLQADSTTRTAWNDLMCDHERNYICEKRF